MVTLRTQLEQSEQLAEMVPVLKTELQKSEEYAALLETECTSLDKKYNEAFKTIV